MSEEKTYQAQTAEKVARPFRRATTPDAGLGAIFGRPVEESQARLEYVAERSATRHEPRARALACSS